MAAAILIAAYFISHFIITNRRKINPESGAHATSTP